MAKTRQPETEETINLSDILSQEVEITASPATFTPEFENIEQATFDDEAITKKEVEEEQKIIDDSEYSKETIFLNPRDTAETLVGTLDGLQSLGLPFLFKKSYFTGKELEILDTLDTTGATAYPLNSPEQKILAKQIKFQKIVEKIPFTDSENRRLIESTTRYVQQTEMKMTPLTALLISFTDVSLKRVGLFQQLD